MGKVAAAPAKNKGIRNQASVAKALKGWPLRVQANVARLMALYREGNPQCIPDRAVGETFPSAVGKLAEHLPSEIAEKMLRVAFEFIEQNHEPAA